MLIVRMHLSGSIDWSFTAPIWDCAQTIDMGPFNSIHSNLDQLGAVRSIWEHLVPFRIIFTFWDLFIIFVTISHHLGPQLVCTTPVWHNILWTVVVQSDSKLHLGICRFHNYLDRNIFCFLIPYMVFKLDFEWIKMTSHTYISK